ncbi:uncharacterized protein TNCV_435691 [Trichonephila clavipes]|nr:uncharacterized protein TNCV_435691 [Trichonephila clavipes]
MCHRNCGTQVVKVSDHGRHVMRSSPVPFKALRVAQRCMLNLSRVEMSSRWYGSWEKGCQLKCCPRHLTLVQNYVVHGQKPLCS